MNVRLISVAMGVLRTLPRNEWGGWNCDQDDRLP